MKKIFTLIAVALCAMSASAQGTYVANNAAAITGGATETSVTGITLTYGSDDTYAAAKAATNNADADFTAYTVGTANGKFTSGSAPTGCRYIFAPTIDGTLTVGVSLNAAKAFYVVKGSDFTALPIADITPNLPSEAGGASQTFGTNVDSKDKSIDNSIAAKSDGTISFAAKSGETYYVFCTGSKLGFYGCKFTTGTAGINQTVTIPENETPLFNAAGQQVSGSYKGLIIQKGKKFVNK